MRIATNQLGFSVEIFTPFGWSVAGCGKMYATREDAQAGMDELKARFPDREFRLSVMLGAA